MRVDNNNTWASVETYTNGTDYQICIANGAAYSYSIYALFNTVNKSQLIYKNPNPRAISNNGLLAYGMKNGAVTQIISSSTTADISNYDFIALQLFSSGGFGYNAYVNIS